MKNTTGNISCIHVNIYNAKAINADNILLFLFLDLFYFNRVVVCYVIAITHKLSVSLIGEYFEAALFGSLGSVPVLGITETR